MSISMKELIESLVFSGANKTIAIRQIEYFAKNADYQKELELFCGRAVLQNPDSEETIKTIKAVKEWLK